MQGFVHHQTPGFGVQTGQYEQVGGVIVRAELRLILKSEKAGGDGGTTGGRLFQHRLQFPAAHEGDGQTVTDFGRKPLGRAQQEIPALCAR